MALVICPECGKEKVSDSAVNCPDCGFPIREHFKKLYAEQQVKEMIKLTLINTVRIAKYFMIMMIISSIS